MDPIVQAVIDELHARIDREAQQVSVGQAFDMDQLALAAGPETAGFLNTVILSRGRRISQKDEALHGVDPVTKQGQSLL